MRHWQGEGSIGGSYGKKKSKIAYNKPKQMGDGGAVMSHQRQYRASGSGPRVKKSRNLPPQLCECTVLAEK